jgi:hypothetical protein
MTSSSGLCVTPTTNGTGGGGHLAETHFEMASFGVGGRQRQGGAVGVRGFGAAAEPAQQVGADSG